MRILFVSSFHYPGDGVSTHTAHLAQALAKHGHEIAHFAMQDDRNIPDPNSDLFVSNINFVELNRQKSLKTGLQVMSRVIYSTEARRKFAALLDRFQPDIVHLQAFFHFISPSILFEARKRGIPQVFTLHDFKMVCPNTSFFNDRLGQVCEDCGKSKYYMPMIRRCKKGSFGASAMASVEAYAHRLMRIRSLIDAYISPSKFLLNKYIEHGFPSDRLTHIPIGLSDDFFSANEQAGDYVLFFGRVDPLKGVRNLLEACRRLPDVKLKLAGRIAPAMADEIPSSLPPNAEYVGMKQGEELRDLVSRALVVVVPSIWFENQPYSILESFAMGKPVIASDLGGMTELVEHKKRGLLVRPGSVDDLAEAVGWMWANPGEVTGMGKAAVEYVRAEHGSALRDERTLRIYELVLAKPRD